MPLVPLLGGLILTASKLYRYDPAEKQLDHWSTPERLGLLCPSRRQRLFDLRFCQWLCLFQSSQLSDDDLQWLKKIEQDNPGTRLNDGRADRQGRFWAGSMVESGDQGDAVRCTA